MFPILLTAANPAPTPLSADHLRDIGCVAVMAIIAEDQKRSAGGTVIHPRLSADGRTWAGIVGARAASQSGQPVELIAFAMREAALNERRAMAASPLGKQDLSARYADCAALMRADLDADRASAPLPPPVKSQRGKSR